MDGFAITVIVFFIISVALVVFPVPLRIPFTKIRFLLNTATAPLICLIVLAIAQCIPYSVFRDGIVGTEGIKPYNILILFFSLAYMAVSLDLTGLLQAAAFWIANHGGRKGIKLYTSFFLFSTLLSVILGNDPVILSGTAFLVYFTKVAELDPESWLFAEFASCNIGSMVLFVGNPTNLVLCEGFDMQYLTYSAYTLLPFLGCIIAAYVALLAQFWKRIPMEINAPELDARAVLLDPVGAIVGSVLLVSCLIVAVGVSFGGVDVWEIALPFAVVKLLFDIVWDGYRYRKAMPSAVEMEMRATSPGSPQESGASEVNFVFAKTLQSCFGFWTKRKRKLQGRIPTAYTAVKGLPIGLLPFALSQFILVEALVYHGWIKIFSGWMAHLTVSLPATVFSVGILSVVLCNVAGTNILATILLTKILRGQVLDAVSMRGASIALAVGSNIGALSFTFSASLAGLLWRNILRQKGIRVRAIQFLRWNLLPIVATCTVGFFVVWAEIYMCHRFLSCTDSNSTHKSATRL